MLLIKLILVSTSKRGRPESTG